MSVLIKGMKLPKDDAIKVVIRGDDCIASVYIEDGKSDYYKVAELPDHGDLIDRSKLKDKFIGDAFSGKGGYAVWSEDILSAPVVIPAERSE